MQFKDWRTSPEKSKEEEPTPRVNRFRGQSYYSYIDEQIRHAQEHGEFEKLEGYGKPLNLDSNPYAGDKALGYNLLKSNGFAPAEVELAKEIRKETERIEAKLNKVRQQGQALRSRRIPPFASEKRSFNASVEKIISEYESTLRELNRKIHTQQPNTPNTMHQPMFMVEKLLQEFCESCPLL